VPDQAAKDYDDRNWENIDFPHEDIIINGMYDQNADERLPTRQLFGIASTSTSLLTGKVSLFGSSFKASSELHFSSV